MKNLKQMIDDFQSEAKSRIANGEFKVLNVNSSYSLGYIGEIQIKIDEIIFHFSISEKDYVAEHGLYKIFDNSISKKEYKSLKKAYILETKDDRDNQIKELQSKIENLKNYN